MDSIIQFFFNCVSRCASLLNSLNFSLFGLSITWLDLLISFSAICICIAVFWRGVRK